jgi:hypothetical protein
VWRLQTGDGNAIAIRPFPDERMAINMSVWESLEALQHFVYRSAHAAPLRDRRQWFEPIEGPIQVLWWVPVGHIPTVAESSRPSSAPQGAWAFRGGVHLQDGVSTAGRRFSRGCRPGRRILRVGQPDVNTAHIARSLKTLFAELVDGAPGNVGYVLNRGDAGLLRSLERLDGAAASRPNATGSSIAAHVDHVRYGLSLLNRWGAR